MGRSTGDERLGEEWFGSGRVGLRAGLGRTVQLDDAGELADVSCLRRGDGWIVIREARGSYDLCSVCY
ncbi:hypothetical protein ABN034_33960 [Actinopolymorpha sp. B11F2]|uniref:hypothetical protein n=1 Tax=Actinopolymorpha sp. B11F2 TaxID=3160862 RepID=UPI0032E3E401